LMSNYTLAAPTEGVLTIGKASLTITGNSASTTYNGSAQSNGFTTSTLYGSDAVTGVSGLASGTNAGTYTDALSGATGSGLANYTISYTNGSLTLAPNGAILAQSAWPSLYNENLFFHNFFSNANKFEIHYLYIKIFCPTKNSVKLHEYHLYDDKNKMKNCSRITKL